MKIAAMENPRSRQEELGQFLTATPVADFMASMFAPRRGATNGTPRDHWGLLVKAIIEVFCARWSPGPANAMKPTTQPSRYRGFAISNSLKFEGIGRSSTQNSQP